MSRLPEENPNCKQVNIYYTQSFCYDEGSIYLQEKKDNIALNCKLLCI